MQYKVTHTTTYDYSDPVALCRNEAHLTPRNGPGQTCGYHRLVIHPVPSSQSKRTDYFGNVVNLFSIDAGHRRLRVSAVCKIAVFPRPVPVPSQSPPWETVRDALRADRTPAGLDAFQYAFDSPHVTQADELARYALASFVPGRPLLAAALHLTSRIHADFTYDPRATTVSTPLTDVFRNRRGVCQDLAHVQIGCLRSIGLAARYVSGYLRTIPPEGRPRLIGADASHAWLSIYGGPQGWIDLDPTNDVVPGSDHIVLAWGRDYHDVCPINGMYVGGGQHTMTVGVTVTPLDDPD